MLGTTKHVINETVRLIEYYDLSDKQVKYLQDRLLNYKRPNKK